VENGVRSLSPRRAADLSSITCTLPGLSHQREDAMAIEPGDVVTLKSGGQPMTVAAVDENSVECLWIGDDGELFRETIPSIALTAVAMEDQDDDLDVEDEDDDEHEEHDEAEHEDEDEGKSSKKKRRSA
jgi:uncharacterized protein YodC (DUF2158 family)